MHPLSPVDFLPPPAWHLAANPTGLSMLFKCVARSAECSLRSVAVFTGRVRRSGKLRSVWHKRERKRRPQDLPTIDAVPPTTSLVTRSRYNLSEADWLCRSPDTMIQCLATLTSDRLLSFHMTTQAVERKLRLFYCACCRLRWAALPSDEARQTVEVIERHADGAANRDEWAAARRRILLFERAARRLGRVWLIPPEMRATADLTGLIVEAAKPHRSLQCVYGRAGWSVDATERIALLLEIFANPFHPIAVEPTHITGTVQALARTIYSERMFDLMPILADALMDAGCGTPQIIDHCRGPAAHTRGCWVLDLLLGKS